MTKLDEIKTRVEAECLNNRYPPASRYSRIIRQDVPWLLERVEELEVAVGLLMCACDSGCLCGWAEAKATIAKLGES